MKSVLLGKNLLDTSSWTTHEVEDVCAFLRDEFGERFPETGKIYHQSVDLQHEVTPKTDEQIEKLQSLPGPFCVLIYPALTETAAVGLLIQGAILIAGAIVTWLLAPERNFTPKFKLEDVTGSPNNKLGSRQNVARPLGRIPYILGMVRSTPDLLADPYTIYDLAHREIETSYMCVGVGPHNVIDIREGDTLSTEIRNSSVAVYQPGDIPTGVEGTSDRSVQIGDFITDPVFTVRRVEAVNGQPMLPDNVFMILGDVLTGAFSATPTFGAGVTNFWNKFHFTRTSAGNGNIFVGVENVKRILVGDKFSLFFPTTRVTTNVGLNTFAPKALFEADKIQFWSAIQDGTGAIPDLTGVYTVVAVNDFSIDVTWPIGPIETEWLRIATYTAGSPSDTTATIGNGGAIMTLLEADQEGKEWVGPFFVDDSPPLPTTTRTVICNFVAQQGLYVDDGRSSTAYDALMEVEVTPADSTGAPTGAPALHQATLLGSKASRNTRAITMRIGGAEVQGRFLIRARRLTRTPWKDEAPSQYSGRTYTSYAEFYVDNIANSFNFELGTFVPAASSALAGYPLVPGDRIIYNGGGAFTTDEKNSAYLPFKGQAQDDIRWTHCYSLTTVEFLSFGNVTTIHSQSVASEGSKIIKERKLNCLAFREIATWNGSTFGGAPTQDNKAENCLFSVLKDPFIGNLPDAQIDFPGIAAAFAEVRAHFGGTTIDGIGGEEAGQFNYTFDDEKLTLEDTIGIICRACFCIPYRDGNVIKVKPDLPSIASTLLINHRNRIPNSEQRTVNFGTDLDFDSVRIDYQDISLNTPNDDTVKSYFVPAQGFGSRPKIISVPGTRLRKHAAWHAWRVYNQLLYQNTVVEVRATEEAHIAIIDDRIRVADVTNPETMDGQIQKVTGTTLRTSQAVVTGGDPSTIFLMHTDGTTEAIPIATNPDSRTVVLSVAPSVPLVTDSNLGTPTMYTVVKNDDNTSQVFKVVEKECVDLGVHRITGTNYTHAFYWNDGLYFWLPVIILPGVFLTTLRDWGPYVLTFVTINGANAVTDALRGQVYEGTANNQHIQITTADTFASNTYTKACWVFKANDAQPGCILCSVETLDESFLVTGATPPNLIAGHGATAVSAPFPTSVWTHCAVTFDDVSNEMLLYINGSIVDTATIVAPRGIGNLRLFGQFEGVNGLIGRADDLRYYQRVLSPEEIRELYLKTLII